MRRRRAVPRSARGKPEQTRDRLVAAAAATFERDGYQGTDSNRIAAAAGYATGTFYKHFADKRDVLLAAYARWLADEWAAVEAELAHAAPKDERARRIVELVARMHRRGRAVRAAVLALVPTDATVRRFYRARRRTQLDALAGLRARGKAVPAPRERDALLLFTLERSADALANLEHRALGLDRDRIVDELAREVAEALA